MGGHGHKQPPKPSGATNLRMDYIQIAEGVKNGTLKPLPPPETPETWCAARWQRPHGRGPLSAPPRRDARRNVTNHRFSSNPLTSASFGEPFNARQAKQPSYGFGTCSRNDAKLVFIKEVANGQAGVSPGPAAYGAKGFFGPVRNHPIPTVLSTHVKCPMPFMGTDPRDSAEQREMKAQSLQGGGRRFTL